MADAPEIQIADALVEAINAGSYTQHVQAYRTWLPEFSPEKLKDLQVTVTPPRNGITNASRDAQLHEITTVVALQKKLGQADTAAGDRAETDQLVNLAREIREELAGLNVALSGSQYSHAAYVRMLHEPIVNPDGLEQRQFASLIHLTHTLTVHR